MRDTGIQRVLDLMEQLQEEFEHIRNLLEVVGLGFANHDCAGKECEVSSLYILSNYLEKVELECVIPVTELLKEM